MKIPAFLANLAPPSTWKIPVIIVLGIFTGLFFYMLYISNAASYLSDEPATCVNCHIMAPQYATWQHSAHRENTNCNDCHVPHNNVFNKYFFKAKDGLRHATIFTLRMEPQVIFIKKAGERVVQKNCVRCHFHLLSANDLKYGMDDYSHYRQERDCRECHRYSPHGRINSLSSTPDARVPLPESPVPEWIKEKVKGKR
jgi:cytochrome c nitrite reductase small subunit